MTKAELFWRSRLERPTRHLHWFAASLGITASFACAGFLISNPIGTPQSAAVAVSWDAVEHIPGLGGTTFEAAQNEVQIDQIIDPDAKVAQPANWKEIETPGCLTVTTENGHELSFRIKGYRVPAADGANDPSVKVDLAVAACSQSSEQVINAVFEPDAGKTIIKSTSAERNL